ncbi:MAG: amidohydrolase [Desulfobulbaceae bacterium A2]|nr:MAG: amidohydrolase [Desulfobulbaceae bacterium A2]
MPPSCPFFDELLLVNIRIAAMPGEPEPPAGPAWILLRGPRIQALGAVAESPPPPAGLRETLDGGGMLALPGLINGHCHAAMTLFRGLADDLALNEWLMQHIFPAEARHVNPEMVCPCTRLAAAEMLLAGITTVADGYFFEDAAAEVFAEAGMRAVAAQGVLDFPAPGVPDPTKNVATAAAFMRRWQGHPLIRPAVFAHSPYTCSAATLRKAKAAAEQAGALFFLHLAEARDEGTRLIDPAGPTPLRHVQALGLLDARTVCVHSIWLDDTDLALLAASGAGAVICPHSHAKLASGMAPLTGMRQRGIAVALGTDGAASNNALDLFREMDLCAKMQKGYLLDPTSAPARDMLVMATSMGARVLGYGNELGRLAPGALADIILLDLSQPHLTPYYGSDLLVYAASGADVDTVLVHGRVVVQHRQLLTIDLPATLHQVRRLAERLS